MVTKDGITFEKYVALYKLEAYHDVDLGHANKTAPLATLFTYYIMEPQHQALSMTKFCSFMMDGTTGADNNEQKLIFLLTCKENNTAGEIKSYASFFSVATPKRADASGLVKCLSQCLLPLGIEDILDQGGVLTVEVKPVLVGD